MHLRMPLPFFRILDIFINHLDWFIDTNFGIRDNGANLKTNLLSAYGQKAIVC